MNICSAHFVNFQGIQDHLCSIPLPNLPAKSTKRVLFTQSQAIGKGVQNVGLACSPCLLKVFNNISWGLSLHNSTILNAFRMFGLAVIPLTCLLKVQEV